MTKKPFDSTGKKPHQRLPGSGMGFGGFGGTSTYMCGVEGCGTLHAYTGIECDWGVIFYYDTMMVCPHRAGEKLFSYYYNAKIHRGCQSDAHLANFPCWHDCDHKAGE